MEEVTVKTWEGFEERIKALESREYDVLYRGQANSKAVWKLETTLDRFGFPELKLMDYYSIIYLAKPRIEAFIDKSWNIPSPKEYAKWLKERRDFLFLSDMPGCDYMAYLRHYGFPSPLLDWTSSPYIAAFFAYNRIDKNVENVSIYAFQEHIGLGKIATNQEPFISSFGDYVSTHKRHLLQQSKYTICTLKKGNDWYFAHHEDVAGRDKKQDLLWKFNIPSAERIKVLRMLDRFNINSFSLFGSEESLMDMIATKELLIKRGFD